MSAIERRGGAFLPALFLHLSLSAILKLVQYLHPSYMHCINTGNNVYLTRMEMSFSNKNSFIFGWPQRWLRDWSIQHKGEDSFSEKKTSGKSYKFVLISGGMGSQTVPGGAQWKDHNESSRSAQRQEEPTQTNLSSCFPPMTCRVTAVPQVWPSASQADPQLLPELHFESVKGTDLGF